jgi:hypothetical protein
LRNARLFSTAITFAFFREDFYHTIPDFYSEVNENLA